VLEKNWHWVRLHWRLVAWKVDVVMTATRLLLETGYSMGLAIARSSMDKLDSRMLLGLASVIRRMLVDGARIAMRPKTYLQLFVGQLVMFLSARQEGSGPAVYVADTAQQEGMAGCARQSPMIECSGHGGVVLQR
jgi:hypothetical protein